MLITDLIKQIEYDFPIMSSMDFDNSGSNVVDYNATVSGVLVTLDITLESIEYAKNNNINLIISHHPIIFNKIRNLNDDPVAKRIKMLNKYDISAYSCHTNYDVNIKNGMGTNLINILFDKTDIKEQKILENYKINDTDYGIGNIITFNKKIAFEDFKDDIVKKLKLDNNKISFYKYKDNIEKVVIIPGSGSGEIDLVINEKIDLLITSDLKHNQILDLIESGISYFNATHYGLENIFIDSFYNYLKSLDILNGVNIMRFDIKL